MILTKKITFLLVFLFLLNACGGSSGGAAPAENLDSVVEEGSDTLSSGGAVTYAPLAVFEPYIAYSEFDSDGMFQGGTVFFPEIKSYLINPLDVGTLQSVTTALVSDFTTTVDDIEIDGLESFPVLQHVIGTEVILRTALVFDLSNSVSDANIPALVDEAKAYIAEVKSSSNETIRNQEFVVWVFGTNVAELTNGFTGVLADINTALDTVTTQSVSKAQGLSSNLHKAVVEVVGRYSDATYDFGVGPDNDLYDRASLDGVSLSQMVLFSSGSDTYREFTQEQMIQAVNSQQFRRYDLSDGAFGDEKYFNKPVFYYVLGGNSVGNAYEALSDVSEVSSDLILSSDSTYSFASGLIQEQINAIDARIDLTNQYLYRFAFVPRVGDHTVVFASNTTASIQTLTTDISADDLDVTDGTPEEEGVSLVEITGVNGEYISSSTILFSEAQTFATATRWTNQNYGAGDYSWSFPDGDGVGTLNGDGSYTVNSFVGASVRLMLTNTSLAQNAIITIAN